MPDAPTHTTCPPAQLIVFADDWGRHPSSAQHLIGQLLSQHPTCWVNTVGTRVPKLRADDLHKAIAKLTQWIGFSNRRLGQKKQDHASKSTSGELLAPSPILNPLMVPGFGKRWQRQFNKTMMARCIHRHLPARQPSTPSTQRIAIATLPITADLVGMLDVDRWVYYCVDDFSVWPGLDGRVLDDMEKKLVSKVDQVICVSDTLVQRIASMGKTAQLLTHGIDLGHWQQAATASDALSTKPSWWPSDDKPTLLFWGLVDQRLDTDLCLQLAQHCGHLLLVGPMQSPDTKLLNHPNIHMPGPVDYQLLPGLAARCDVLVMPYAQLPVTRAMQPLKLKEYLATGKAAVVRQLPATLPWAQGADVADNIDPFVMRVQDRLTHGVSASQLQARLPLKNETWEAKAQAFEAMILS